MPVRGKRIRRDRWFYAVERKLTDLGFRRGDHPTLGGVPGFYFYEKRGFRVQIAPHNTLRISRPSGRLTEDRVPSLDDVEFILDALELEMM